jgi:hypothetical protein
VRRKKIEPAKKLRKKVKLKRLRKEAGSGEKKRADISGRKATKGTHANTSRS